MFLYAFSVAEIVLCSNVTTNATGCVEDEMELILNNVRAVRFQMAYEVAYKNIFISITF